MPRESGQALVGFIMPVEQRLSRWLLMAHDRVQTDQFPLTQEFAWLAALKR
jgi:hypothetical protein